MVKKSNIRRRIIAIVLAVMMLLSVMPTTAFAADGDVAQIGETTYSDLVTALDEASKEENAGCTLTLLADVKLSAYYDIESKFTLDLNGKKIERNDSGAALYIENGGDLTVIDSVGGGSIVSGTAIHCNYGKLTLGKADGTASDFTIKGTGSSLYVVNTDVTVYGGTFIAGSIASIVMIDGIVATILGEGLAFAKKDDTTSIVNGYVVEKITESVTVVKHTHSFDENGDCACGAVKTVAQIGETTYTDFVTALDDASKEENAGCTLKLLSDVYLSELYSIKCTEFTLDLNGKKIENTTNNLIDVDEGNVTIIDSVGGGKIVSGWVALSASYDGYITFGKADGTASDFTVSGDGAALLSYGVRATIYGGTYEGGSLGSIYVATGMGYVQPLLDDGYAFAKKDDTTSIVNANVASIPEAVTVVPHTHTLVDGECECGFKYVAQIGETKYSNFEKALGDVSKAENAGCTLTLLDDVGLSDYYDVESKFTLDLNGKKIERYSTVFFIENGGDLTIIDSVGGGSIVTEGTTLQCNDGNLTLGKADGTASYFTISGDTRAINIGYDFDVTIYGGTFVAGSNASIETNDGTVARFLGEGLAFAKKDDTASLVNGYVDIITESVTVVKHTHNIINDECACGYKYVAQIGDVKYADFVTALDEAGKEENAGCTLTLLDDVVLSMYYDIVSKFTLDLNGKKIERDSGTAFYTENGADFTVIDSVGGGSISGTPAIYSNEGKLTLGKADGTANNFTLISTRDRTFFVGYYTDITIYGGTFVAGSESSIGRVSGTGNAIELLGEGLAFAKKDDTSSLVNGYVDTITESVTVVKHTHNLVDNECGCGFKYAAQIGETKYTDFVTALNEACKAENAGCTLTLLADVRLSTYYNIKSKFTLDLNGKKISASITGFYIENGGDLTVIDSVGGGSIVSVTAAIYYNNGKLTFGKADGTASDFTLNGGYRSLHVAYNGDITIYGGTFIVGTDASIEMKSNVGNVITLLGEGYAFAKKDDTTSIVNANVEKLTESVTVVKHTHSFDDDSNCVCGAVDAVASIGDTTYTDFVTALDEASTTVNSGCTVKLLKDVNLSEVYNVNCTKFTIDLNGKKIENSDGNLLKVVTGSVTIIDSVGGGKIVSSWAALIASYDGYLTLGKEDGTASDFTVSGEGSALISYGTRATIYGGTYEVGTNGSILITTGMGYVQPLLGEGYALAKKDDTTSIVNAGVEKLTEAVTVVKHTHNFDDGDCACGKQGAVAQVGSTTYSDVTEAFNAAKEINGTVKLLKNATLSTRFNLTSYSITLDLNGKKLTTSNDNYGIFLVNNTARLYIIDTVGGGSIVSKKPVIITEGSDCRIVIGNENGDNNFTLQSTESYVVNVSDASQLKIYGGTFLGSETNNRIELDNGVLSSSLVDNKAFVKASDTSSFVNSNQSAIAEDVKVVDHTHNINDDGVCSDCGFEFTVKIGDKYFATLSSAMDYIEECEDDLSVTIINDINEEYCNFVEGDYIIDLKGHSITSEDCFDFDSFAHVTLIDTVGGGVISSNDEYNTIYMSSYYCSLTIGTSDGKNGVIINSEEGDAICITSGSLTIYDGTFTGGYNGLYIYTYVDVNLYGGTFSSIYYWFDSYDMYAYKALNLTDILGENRAYSIDGNIVDASSDDYYFEECDDDSDYKVWYFNSTVSVVEHTHDYVDGKCACGDLQYVAKIGENYYTTLEEAFAAAEEMTGKVELHILKNCKIVDDLEVHAKELWIYLDGNVLYSSNNGDYSRLILCDGTYNFCGDGMVHSSLYGYYDYDLGEEGTNATINIRGGIYSYVGYAGSDTLNIYDAEYIDQVDATYYGENAINIYGGTIGYFYVSDDCVNRPILHGGKFGYISVYSNYSDGANPYELLAEGKGYYCDDSDFFFNNDGTSYNSDWIEVKNHTKHVWNNEYGFCTAGGESHFEACVDVGGASVRNFENLEDAIDYALNYGSNATIYLLKDSSIDSLTLTTDSSDHIIELNLQGYTISGNKADTTITLENIYFTFNTAYGGTVNTDIVINDDDDRTVVNFNSIATYNGDVLIKGNSYVVVYNGIFNGSFGFVGNTLPNIELICGSFKKLYAPAGFDWYSALSSNSKYYSGTPDQSFTEDGTEFVGFDGTQSGTHIVVAEESDSAAVMVTVPDSGEVLLYDSLENAINYVSGLTGTTRITLLDDVSFSGQGQLAAYDLTLDLNGHNITGDATVVVVGYDFRICGNGDVSSYIVAMTNGKQGTVIDGGTYSSYVGVVNGGKLQINNGEFALVVVADGSECVINGGTIETFAVQSSETDLTLNGGTFTKMASSEENVDFTKFLGKEKKLELGDAVYGTFKSMDETLYGYVAENELIQVVNEKASVVSVDFDKPVLGDFNQYYFKVEGRASKLQIAHSDGSTYTFNRYSTMSVNGSRGVVSIKSYDKDGNEVDSLSRLVAYEIWTIKLNLTEDDYTVRAKYEDEWEKGTKSFSVKYDLTHGDVCVTEVTIVDGGYAFKLNGTAQKLQVITSSGATRTYTRSNANVTIKAYNRKGVEVEVGGADVSYEIWTVNITLSDNDYRAIVKYYYGGTYYWSNTKYSFSLKEGEILTGNYVDNLDDFSDALTELKETGGTIKISQNLTFPSALVLQQFGTTESPLVLDLCGNTITGNFCVVESNVVIKNGTINYAPEEVTDISNMSAVLGYGTTYLGLEDLTINVEDAFAVLNMNGQIQINDCTVTGGMDTTIGEDYENMSIFNLVGYISFSGKISVENLIGFTSNANETSISKNSECSINGSSFTATENIFITSENIPDYAKIVVTT